MKSITPAFITLLMLGLVALLIGAYIIKSMIPKPVAKAEIGIRTVPMASTDIPAGTLITSDHILQGRLREDKLTRDIILNRDAIVGRYALKDIKQAQAVHTAELYAPGTRPPLGVSPGMRAITIGLGDSTAVVDGLIKPGDYVDVHMTIGNNSGDRRYRGGFTTTMFKGVKVLAMNRLTQQAPLNRGGNTVTFELTPAQSNILLQAKTKAELSITYTHGPGTGGIEIAEADRAYFEEILGLPEIPEPEKPFTTEIYRGSNRSVIGYDDDFGGRNYNNFNNNNATPWQEQPGWAPPKTGSYGTGGYGRGGAGGRGGWGGWGNGNNARGNGGRGYRGTSNDTNQQGGQNGNGSLQRERFENASSEN